MRTRPTALPSSAAPSPGTPNRRSCRARALRQRERLPLTTPGRPPAPSSASAAATPDPDGLRRTARPKHSSKRCFASGPTASPTPRHTPRTSPPRLHPLVQPPPTTQLARRPAADQRLSGLWVPHLAGPFGERDPHGSPSCRCGRRRTRPWPGTRRSLTIRTTSSALRTARRDRDDRVAAERDFVPSNTHVARPGAQARPRARAAGLDESTSAPCVRRVAEPPAIVGVRSSVWIPT